MPCHDEIAPKSLNEIAFWTSTYYTLAKPVVQWSFILFPLPTHVVANQFFISPRG